MSSTVPTLARLVGFWSLTLDCLPSPPPLGFATWNDWYRSVGVPHEELDLTGDGTDRLIDPARVGPPIWFQAVPEGKSVENRLHLDIFVGRDEAGREAAVRGASPTVRPRPTSCSRPGPASSGRRTVPAMSGSS